MPKERRMPEELDEFRRGARTVGQRARFPIRNHKQLVEAMGGDDATIEIRGASYTAREIKKRIPKRFFPITNEEELTAKAATLAIAAGLDIPEPEHGQEGEPEEGKRPPQQLGEEEPPKGEGDDADVVPASHYAPSNPTD